MKNNFQFSTIRTGFKPALYRRGTPRLYQYRRTAVRLYHCLLLLLLPLFGAAQNGITISNFRAAPGKAAAPDTLAFDIEWTKLPDTVVWSDTVWVFIDYNNAGAMMRLPLATGATLTNPSWEGARVIEVPDNDNGVWVVGNARTEGSFSATVRASVGAGLEPAPGDGFETRTLHGACIYAINYPPVGRYTAANQIKFNGTPDFFLTFTDASTATVLRAAAGTYVVPPDKALASFHDASLAPGKCIPMLDGIDIALPPYVIQHQATTFTARHPQAPASFAISYTWSAPSFNPDTHTGATFSPTAPATNTYAVTLTATAAGHCDESLTKNVTVLDCTPPAIQSLSASRTSICDGSAVTFTLSASQGSEWSYQLYKDGTQVANTVQSGTGGALKFGDTPAVGGHTYTVRTVNGGGVRCEGLASSEVLVTVHQLPVITSTPPATICYNTAKALTADVNGGATSQMTYTWVIGGSSSTNTANSKTSPALTATTTYTVSVTNANGCTATLAPAVTIPVAASFTAQANPSPATICYNTTTTLSPASATGGTGGITYKWQQSPSWADAAGANTNAAYTTPALTVTTAYRRTAYNQCGTITSAAATVTVRPVFTPGSISTTGQTICSGASVNTITSSAAASGGDQSITYEWRRNGEAIVGSTDVAAYAPAAYNKTTGGHTFTRWAKDGACNTSWTQSAGTWGVTVHALPFITSTPPSTLCYNTAASLSAGVTDGATSQMTYTWNIGGSSSTNTANSKTSPALTANTTYTVSVTNANGCTATLAAAVTIPVAKQFTQSSPTAVTICHNTTTTLSPAVATGGIGNITYKWQQSPSWADATNTNTNAAYTTPALTTTTAYRRVAYNACSTITSAAATVTVRPAFTPGSITTGAQTICAGAALNTIDNAGTASGGDGTISYEWRYTNGTASGTIASSTAALTPTVLQSKPGTWTVTRWAKDGACNAWTQSAGSWVFTVNPLPTVNSTTSASRCGAGEVILKADPSGGAVIDWYTAASGGTSITTNSSYNTGYKEVGVYDYYAEARIVATGCVSASRTQVTATINVIPDPPTNVSGGGTACDSKSISATPGNYGVSIYWNDGSTAASHAVTSGGQYCAYSVSAAGCWSTDSRCVSVTIVVSPSLTVNRSAVAVCEGTSFNFTADYNKGTLTWTSVYSPGQISGDKVTYSTSTTGSASGTRYYVDAQVSYRASNITCNDTDWWHTYVVSYPTAPTVTPSAANVCQGTPLVFTATGYTGKLQWTSYTSGNVTANTAGTVTYTGSAATGAKTVTARSYNNYSSTTYCYSGTVTKSANVVAKPAAPTITFNQPTTAGTACVGVSIQFSASCSSGKQYWPDWTNPTLSYSGWKKDVAGKEPLKVACYAPAVGTSCSSTVAEKTIEWKGPGADGESSECGCNTGTTDCSGTCKTNSLTERNVVNQDCCLYTMYGQVVDQCGKQVYEGWFLGIGGKYDQVDQVTYNPYSIHQVGTCQTTNTICEKNGMQNGDYDEKTRWRTGEQKLVTTCMYKCKNK